MWVYEKKLQYPVNIKQTNPKLAKIIISQYGGLYCKKIYKKPPARICPYGRFCLLHFPV